MSRHAYIVTYDICDPKRLRKVFVIMKGHGQHIQLSVFRCELNPRERLRLELKLDAELLHGVDQVLFIDLGPAKGRGKDCIEALGRPFGSPVRGPFIV
jgi:CRISPR-associated protein Cas2